ncbi:MAG: hypothetical protein Q8K58_02350 [Acidimicrobiales bacterium]|nr:hypothetical protein [Acidimicrobiales bacterium]
MVRRAALLVVLAAAVTVVSAPAPAPAQAPGPELVELCEDSGLGDRTCASVVAGSVLLASLCADSGAPPEACAAATDGEVVDPAVLARYESGWVHRALRLQSRLDEARPLVNSLWPHSHNSANSTAYAPSVSSLDPNQRWSILDQLRMGIRAIELDLHPGPGGGVVLCHGRQVDLGATIVHLGCSVDRPLSAGLEELRSFLDLPGNEREVVLLYLENQLESDPVLHDVVAQELQRALGPLVARPAPGAPCAEMPLDRSRADLLADERRVLVVGDCGPGGWGSWVHERGPRWDERSLGDGYAPYPDCMAFERASRAYDDTWIRVYEDATWLSAVVDGRFRPQTADDVREMVHCGVDMVGFDRISPTDPRLAALVWSWAEGEPVEDPARRCVALGNDGRFRAAGCEEERGYACHSAAGEWLVPEAVGPASGAGPACATVGAAPATPPTGWDNERLKAAAGTARELWLPIPNPLDAASSAARPPLAALPAAPDARPVGTAAASLPATGRALPAGAAAAVLALLLAARARSVGPSDGR